MNRKKSAIVYGLGRDFELTKEYIHSKFDVVGYSDKDMKKKWGGNFILPTDLPQYEYDYILITSSKYFSEIKNTVTKLIGEKNREKIISISDVFGDFRNYEVRDQWVIDKLGQVPEGKILLDAGAGEQRYKPYCSHLKYIAQDFGKFIPNEISSGLLQDMEWDYTGINITCDIIDMPLSNESVDVVLCTEVFEHLKNPILAIKEFSRILRTNGILILSAPFCCLTHMAPYFYYNGFSEYWYKENLKDYGFEIREFTAYGNYFKYICQELFRVESMAEKYCDVKLESDEINVITKSMEIMMKLSEKDHGSEETLCFGSMLVAEKTAESH